MKHAVVENKTRHHVAKSYPIWWRRCAIIILVMLGGLGTMAFVITIFGRCSGEEFSPNDFRRRGFLYFRIPVVKLQVTPVYRSKHSSALVSHLRSKKLVGGTSQGWQLVSLHSGVADPYEADPIILCRYLDQRDAKHDLTWLKWSGEHADLADVFWPVIARVAGNGLYITLPQLFATARAATHRAVMQPEDLKLALHQRLMADTLVLAQGQYQLAEYEAAIDSCGFVLDTLIREGGIREENAESVADGAARSTGVDDVANADRWLTDMAIKSLRLRSQTYAKCKKPELAKADLRWMAKLQQSQ